MWQKSFTHMVISALLISAPGAFGTPAPLPRYLCGVREFSVTVMVFAPEWPSMTRDLERAIRDVLHSKGFRVRKKNEDPSLRVIVTSRARDCEGESSPGSTSVDVSLDLSDVVVVCTDPRRIKTPAQLWEWSWHEVGPQKEMPAEIERGVKLWIEIFLDEIEELERMGCPE